LLFQETFSVNNEANQTL